MHLIINDGETVRIIYGTYQGRYGVVTKLTLTENRKKYAYTVKLQKDQNRQWNSLTLQFPSDQIKKVRS